MSVPNSQLLTGTFISDGKPRFIEVISGITEFELYDLFTLNDPAAGSGDYISAKWIQGMADEFAIKKEMDVAPPQIEENLVTSAGFTYIDDTVDVVFPAINITNITQANPAVITTAGAHGLIDGDVVQLSVLGMSEIAGMEFVVNVINATSFSIEVDSTGFTAFLSGTMRKTTRKTYELKSKLVTNVTQAVNALVTTSTPHNLQPDMMVSFRFPQVTAAAWGMFGLDVYTGVRQVRVLSVFNETSFVIDYDTTAEIPFAFPAAADQPFTQAQMIVVGESAPGTLNNNLFDASFNPKTRGMYIGQKVIALSGHEMRWVAKKAADI